MKEIKKIFSILLCLCLVCIIPVPAFAEETEKSGELSTVHVVFNENDYKELPALEKGKQKLLSCGYTQTYVENMDEEIILKIAEADSAEQSVTYYQECLDMEQGEGQFKQIDEETYTEITSRLEAESDRQMQELVSTYRIQDAEGNVIYAPEQMPSTYANTFTSSDGGTLELDNTLYHINNEGPTASLIVSQFLWTTMPSHRDSIDFFGLMRDQNTTDIPGCYSAFWGYFEKDYTITANSSITVTEHDPVFTEINDVPNETEDNVYNYSIKIGKVPANSDPQEGHIFSPGETLMARHFYGLQGGLQYGQSFSNESAPGQSCNIWFSYLHQLTGHIEIDSVFIQAGFPWSVGFGVTPKYVENYEKVVDPTKAYVRLRWE